MTKAQRLEARRTALLADLSRRGGSDAEVGAQIAQIDRELKSLARRRIAARIRRELLFDINGHYGPA